MEAGTYKDMGERGYMGAIKVTLLKEWCAGKVRKPTQRSYPSLTFNPSRMNMEQTQRASRRHDIPALTILGGFNLTLEIQNGDF
jgi:hypothetical protein